MEAIDRFLLKTSKAGNGCVEWTAGRNKDGYGKFWIDGATVPAHRVAYELFVGPIPQDLWVIHDCDNPCCVAPGHLRAGTPRDNALDMVAKRRHVDNAGEAHGCAKLTEAKVKEIRRIYAEGKTSQRKLGTLFGVGDPTICLIVNRKLWKHVA